MPLYEYLCQQCGKRFDVLQKFSDEPLKTHEECGGPVERLLSPPALQFKGTGWYVTDYKKPNGPGAANGSAEGKKAETKTETKAESSTPPASPSTPAAKTE